MLSLFGNLAWLPCLEIDFAADLSLYAIAKDVRTERVKLNAPLAESADKPGVSRIATLLLGRKMRQARICYVFTVERDANQCHERPVFAEPLRQIDFRHVQPRRVPIAGVKREKWFLSGLVSDLSYCGRAAIAVHDAKRQAVRFEDRGKRAADGALFRPDFDC